MSGQIFISYRREDSSAWAGRLSDRISTHFPQSQIFMDVDMDLGINFVEEIEKSVGACDVLIAVIGKHWLTASDREGRRRLDHPKDYVRLEIATALKRGIRVIPVLVEGASMPEFDQLPEDLNPLTYRNALNVSHERFRADSERLIGAVERVLENTGIEQQRKREEQERVATEQRERQEKERLEAEQRAQAERRELERRQQEEEARLRAEQQVGVEQERLEAERRQKEDQERLRAEQREKERLELERREPKEKREQPKAEQDSLNVQQQHEGENKEAGQGTSSQPLPAQALPVDHAGRRTKPLTKRPWLLLAVLGGVVLCGLVLYVAHPGATREPASTPAIGSPLTQTSPSPLTTDGLFQPMPVSAIDPLMPPGSEISRRKQGRLEKLGKLEDSRTNNSTFVSIRAPNGTVIRIPKSEFFDSGDYYYNW